MTFKLVALDLDGTLLNSEHEISIENKSVIHKLTQQGIHFVIVTGRPDRMVSHIINQLDIPPIVLANNGASIRNIQTNKLYFHSFLNIQQISQACNILLSNQFYFRIYGLDEVYTFNKNEFDEKKNEFAIFSKRLASQMPFYLIEEISEISGNVIKIVCFENDPIRFKKAESILKIFSNMEVVRGSKNGIDIMNMGTNKGDALLKYAKTLDISPSEIIAIGDSENDISMLECVGLSITLENADPEVKKIANYISCSNNQHGVARALERFLL